ncbi:hypothetical protein BD779DRAFT_1578233 [Infundibulicybe gibba]|nr:hypothetical protein BD779DRAFT_1578233 [Infundibulicybe gibba]
MNGHRSPVSAGNISSSYILHECYFILILYRESEPRRHIYSVVHTAGTICRELFYSARGIYTRTIRNGLTAPSRSLTARVYARKLHPKTLWIQADINPQYWEQSVATDTFSRVKSQYSILIQWIMTQLALLTENSPGSPSSRGPECTSIGAMWGTLFVSDNIRQNS